MAADSIKPARPQDDVVYLPVPRAVLAAAAPEWVSETTVESVFGLDAKRFVRACKVARIDGARKDGQLWLAPVAGVRAYLRGLPTVGRGGLAKTRPPADPDATRAALHVGAKDQTRKRIGWHDLRATGITWRAVRGDDPLKIQRAAGHTELSTTQGYIRTAEDVREGVGEGFGEVFPPLPVELLVGGQ